MEKNTGKEYELLTQMIFSQIVNQDSVETIDVQHNVILQGRDAKHQIDVYWEFKHANIKYYTIIQCRDWNVSVKLEHLLTFKQILQDLPSQPRGIYVTRTGYQSGALDFAKVNGIELFELREFTEEDAKGRVNTINLNLIAYIPHSKIVSIEEDKEWSNEFIEKNNIKGKINIGICGTTDNMFLINENGENVEDIKSFIDKLYPKDMAELPKTRKEICFTNPTFLKTTSLIVPIMKIKRILVDISVSKIELQYKIEFDDIIAFILRNIITDEEHLIKDNLTLLR